MTETRKSMSGCPSAKLLTGLASPNQMDGQRDRQLFTQWTAGQVLCENFAQLLVESWSGVEGGKKNWVCCPWGTVHLAVSTCLWKIWLEMDTAADRVASTQNSILLKGCEQRSSAVGMEHSLVYFFFPYLLYDQFYSHSSIQGTLNCYLSQSVTAGTSRSLAATGMRVHGLTGSRNSPR